MASTRSGTTCATSGSRSSASRAEMVRGDWGSDQTCWGSGIFSDASGLRRRCLRSWGVDGCSSLSQ
eukprot:1440335-Pyramimonas_sp.AAC.2